MFRWVKDKMAVLSTNGEDLSFAAVVLWPDSAEKYQFKRRQFTSWITVKDVDAEDASDVNL